MATPKTETQVAKKGEKTKAQMHKKKRGYTSTPRILYNEQYHCKVAAMLRGDDKTYAEIAAVFQITEQTLYKWAKIHPEFDEVLKKGRLEILANLEMAAQKKCQGHEYEEVRTTVRKLPDGTQETRVERVKKFMPPDSTMIIFLLKSLNPKKYREIVNLRHSGGVALEEDADARNIKEALEKDPDARAAVRAAFSKIYPGRSQAGSDVQRTCAD